MVAHPSLRLALLIAGVTAGLMAMPVADAASPAALSAEAPFLAENQTAMDKMMTDMTIEPSGDVDQDFATMMIAHHQGAIAMAQAELLHGHNVQLRRIARGIVIEQQQEIAAMKLAMGQPLPPSTPAPDRSMPGMTMPKAPQ